MRDAGTLVENPQEEPEVTPAKKSRPSMFRDPVVKRMAIVAVSLVVLFLATIVGVLVTGVTEQSGPRTLAEKEAAVSGLAVSQGSTDASVWGEYIAALIASGQNVRAKDVIAQAKASIDDSATAEFTLAEARLLEAQKDYDKVIVTADAGIKQIEDAHAAIVAAGGVPAQQAKLQGLPENFYIFTLLKADAFREMNEWDKAIEQYDAYIERYPGAADILIDRANAKTEAKDVKGAEADFRKALEFIPDSAEALAGLEKIGASAK